LVWALLADRMKLVAYWCLDRLKSDKENKGMAKTKAKPKSTAHLAPKAAQ